MRCERYRKERDGALDEVDYLRKQLHKARRDENMARLRDKGVSLKAPPRGDPVLAVFTFRCTLNSFFVH